jgi:alkyl hydroperoxide reductase subunit AhpC
MIMSVLPTSIRCPTAAFGRVSAFVTVSTVARARYAALLRKHNPHSTDFFTAEAASFVHAARARERRAPVKGGLNVATLVSQPRNGSANVTLTSPSLRTWLCECWAIFFSHPEDFVPCDLETDRWLVVVRRAFSERGIRPLGLASRAVDLDRGWVSRLSGDACAVMLEHMVQQHSSAIDLQARILREDMASSGQRFVMIIDGALRKHRTFTYSTRVGLPSPLEFLGWADALRAKQAAAVAPKMHAAVAT